jgi:hypothetical protein
MRSRNASGIVTLIHCISSTNSDYDLDLLPQSYFKKIVGEYHSYVNHLAKYKDYMPEELTTKGDALERVRRHLVKLNLITNEQENYELA